MNSTNAYPLLNPADTLKANREIRYKRIPGTQLMDIKKENERMEGAIIKINGFIKAVCTKDEYAEFMNDMMDIDFGKVNQ